MIGLEVLALCAFGAAFLAADAHIFGVSTQQYKSVVQFLPLRDQLAAGVLPLRPLVLRFKFMQDLLSCYFCMGVWMGAAVHVVLINLYGQRYVLWHPSTLSNWAMGLVVAATFSAPVVYALNQVVTLLERANGD